MLGFIIIFHPCRVDNLRQTIRFLERRESLDELVLVCQTGCDPIPNRFHTYQHINLGSGTYWKARMTNRGAEVAKSDILVLLDSDRILPHGYFTRNALLMSPNEIITTKYLWKLSRPYTDAEIESDHVEKNIEFRSEGNLAYCRNLFAGNTMIRKSDYWRLGGYDESYQGYGFADNDMTMKALKIGLNVVFLEEVERHLYHDLGFDWQGVIANSSVKDVLMALNAMNYFLKWGLLPDDDTYRLLQNVEASLNSIPSDLHDTFVRRKFLLEKMQKKFKVFL
jgi:hypothetical protein